MKRSPDHSNKKRKFTVVSACCKISTYCEKSIQTENVKLLEKTKTRNFENQQEFKVKYIQNILQNIFNGFLFMMKQVSESAFSR